MWGSPKWAMYYSVLAVDDEYITVMIWESMHEVLDIVSNLTLPLTLGYIICSRVVDNIFISFP